MSVSHQNEPRKIIKLFANLFHFLTVREVVVSNDESKTVIEGIPVDLGRKEKLLDAKKVNKTECCAICALDLKPTYTASAF